jgi:integrase
VRCRAWDATSHTPADRGARPNAAAPSSADPLERAVELAREGVALNVIQRQLGHANLGTTRIYLQGIDTEEIIATVHARRAPMMSATAGLQL